MPSQSPSANSLPAVVIRKLGRECYLHISTQAIEQQRLKEEEEERARLESERKAKEEEEAREAAARRQEEEEEEERKQVRATHARLEVVRLAGTLSSRREQHPCLGRAFF